tara:strand:+ start:1087 stop:1266 length:180 start_codon:yes stop_codon:yes gene_type:complete
MIKPTTDKLQLELKENIEKMKQLAQMHNQLQVRNIQIEAIISDRLAVEEEQQKLSELKS